VQTAAVDRQGHAFTDLAGTLLADTKKHRLPERYLQENKSSIDDILF
jgi:hypothetical protein